MRLLEATEWEKPTILWTIPVVKTDAFMDKRLQDIINEAERILQEQKEELMRLLTAHGTGEYAGPRSFLMFLEEEAKYRIRALGLPKHLLKHYMARICDIYGPYSEDQPGPGKKYYDNDLYLPS